MKTSADKRAASVASLVSAQVSHASADIPQVNALPLEVERSPPKKKNQTNICGHSTFW